MKLRWTMPMEKKFFSDNLNLYINNNINTSRSNITTASQNFLNQKISHNKIYSENKQNYPVKAHYGKKHILNINEYLFYIRENDIYIFKIVFRNEKETEASKNSSSNTNSDSYNSREADLIIQDIKKINFIAFDENIIYCLLNKDNNNILISTDAGSIYIIGINFSDFFIEILFTFNIKQNFLYFYEILYFCGKANNILLTMDNHLFLCEIYNKRKNQPIQVYKNCLLKCEYLDENILYAEKKDNLVVVFSNKSIYLIDLIDISTTIFLKKEAKNNFCGRIFGENIYFIKDDNTYAIYSIKDKDKKQSIKLSSKNQLNVLSFDTILYVDKELMIISNSKNTELYFISLITYKILNRESILFEDPNFLLCEIDMKKNQNKIPDKIKFLLALLINKENFFLRYKIGYIENTKAEKDFKIIEENSQQEAPLQEGNSNDICLYKNNIDYYDESGFIEQENFKNKQKFYQENIIHKISINSIDLEVASKAKKQCKNKNVHNNSHEQNLHDLENEYLEESEEENNFKNQIKFIINYIRYCLKFLKGIHHIHSRNSLKNYVISKEKFLQIKEEILIFFNLLDITSTFLGKAQIEKSKNFINFTENKIKIFWIGNYGSYKLIRIYPKLNDEYIKNIKAEKIYLIFEVCKESYDLQTYKETLKKFGAFLYNHNKTEFRIKLGFY